MLTEKEKAFAEWLAKEVVGILKKDGIKPNDIALDEIIATAIKNTTKKSANDANKEEVESNQSSADIRYLKNLDIGLSLYGFNTRILSEEFIQAYSSGKLKDYYSCSYFLNQKFLNETSNGGFDKRIKTTPAYFTYYELSAPVVNPFFIQSGNNILSVLLDIPVNELKDIIGYEKYVITKSNEQYWNENDIIPPKHYYELKEQNFKLEFATGSEAIKQLLSSFDPSTALKELKKKYSNKGKNIPQKIQKRIDVLEYFVYRKIDVQNILISVLPVPQVEELLKNATKQTRTEIKNMYLTVVETSERAIDLANMNISPIIINNQKRLLQLEINKLFSKSLKAYLCQMDMFHTDNDESDYLLDENQKAFLALLGSSKDNDAYVWMQFVALLFCLEITHDIVDSSAFCDFLWNHNAFEDKDVWDLLLIPNML